MKKFVILLISALLLTTCTQNKNQKPGDQITITVEEAKALAKDAYLFGMPLVFFEKQFDYNSYATKVEKTKAPVNQFIHYRAFVDATDRSVVGFNVDNLYSLANLDLTTEPIILSIPEMGNRFWLMQIIDAWNGVPAAPGFRTHGSKGGTFAIVGPDWKGQLPQGIEELKSPTNLAIIGGRTYCSGPADYAAVHILQDQYKLTPLSGWGKNYTPLTNVPLKNGATDSILVNKQFLSLSTEQFYQSLNRLMAKNPPYITDSAMLNKIARIGIKPSADFSMSMFTPEVAKAIEEGYAEGYKAMIEESKQLGKIVNGWSLTYDMGKYGTGMLTEQPGPFSESEEIYLKMLFISLAQLDADNNRLNAANSYSLTFAKDQIPPAKAFWSLTMYDADAYLVPNKLNRYALGDRSNLKFGKDGSLTLYLQKNSPGKDKESNWLPTPTSGEFKVALRLYIPAQKVIDGSWLPPTIKRD